jgi:hypothetical protein
MRAYSTVYKGIRFRSRLEAKWAWMFDQFGWPWEYEPFELNNYIPDFIIPFKFGGDMLIEVKPIVNHERESYSAAIAKIEQSGWFSGKNPDGAVSGSVTILGASIWVHPWKGHHIVGLQFDDTSWLNEWTDSFVLRCRDCQKVFPYPSHGERSCRWCGSDDKHYMWSDHFDVGSYWIGAKNHFQWKGQRT